MRRYATLLLFLCLLGAALSKKGEPEQCAADGQVRLHGILRCSQLSIRRFVALLDACVA